MPRDPDAQEDVEDGDFFEDLRLSIQEGLAGDVISEEQSLARVRSIAAAKALGETTSTHRNRENAFDSEASTDPNDFRRELQLGIEEALAGKGISARESLARLGVELDEADKSNTTPRASVAGFRPPCTRRLRFWRPGTSCAPSFRPRSDYQP